MTAKLFTEVVMNYSTDKYKGKQEKEIKFEVISTDLNATVPETSLKLWRKRGFNPIDKGIAIVRFENGKKDYIYPLFFDVEVKQKES